MTAEPVRILRLRIPVDELLNYVQTTVSFHFVIYILKRHIQCGDSIGSFLCANLIRSSDTRTQNCPNGQFSLFTKTNSHWGPKRTLCNLYFSLLFIWALKVRNPLRHLCKLAPTCSLYSLYVSIHIISTVLHTDFPNNSPLCKSHSRALSALFLLLLAYNTVYIATRSFCKDCNNIWVIGVGHMKETCICNRVLRFKHEDLFAFLSVWWNFKRFFFPSSLFYVRTVY